MMPRYR